MSDRRTSSRNNNLKKTSTENTKQNMAAAAIDQCPICDNQVRENEAGVQCDICQGWFHAKCEKVSDALYAVLNSDENEHLNWYCSFCKRGAKSVMTLLQQLSSRQDGFEKKLEEIEVS